MTGSTVRMREQGPPARPEEHVGAIRSNRIANDRLARAESQLRQTGERSASPEADLPNVATGKYGQTLSREPIERICERESVMLRWQIGILRGAVPIPGNAGLISSNRHG